MNYKHPFTDVPEWANLIVGYMYEKGYTKGISDDMFGSEQLTNARDYTTFMLRTLGYDSDDFNWEKSIDFAVEKELITLEEAQSLQGQIFKRNEMVFMSYNTLKTNLNGQTSSLADELYKNGSLDTDEAFNQGLVNRFETVINNVDSSQDILQIYTPVLVIYAEKEEIGTGSKTSFDLESKEDYVNGYKGGISFKYNFPNWKDLNIKYEISFYNKGQFVKKINYVYQKFQIEHDRGTEFITPVDSFDEVSIVAYPMDSEEIINDINGIFEVITSKDTKILKETILEYGNAHATASDTYNVNVNNQDELNTLVWKMMFSGKTEYANGEVYRPYGHKYIVEGNFSLQFSDEGSSISKERVIELPINDMKENINLIIIFDKGFKLVKVFMVK